MVKCMKSVAERAVPAVIYARYSSSHQREESIEGQVRECREYAEREGYSVLQGMAEWYSVDLSEKVTRGMKENALKAKWTSGTVPFGYTRDAEQRLIIDPERGEYVRQIFEKVLAGEKYVDIAS